jgi:hypothetical protein
MRVVHTGNAVIEIISRRNDKPALKPLCDARHTIDHAKLTVGSFASPIPDDQTIRHDQPTVRFRITKPFTVTNPFIRKFFSNELINDRLRTFKTPL